MSAGAGGPVCEICGTKAIGVQSLGCCAATVCAEHAEPALRNARPGEIIVWENCAFQRFEESPSDGGPQ